MHTYSASFRTALSLCLISTSLLVAAQAQSPPDERQKKKDFGSSLKRLKWDEQKKAAVETKNKKEKILEDTADVVRVETSLVVSEVLVLDKNGRAVRGLTQDDFIVTEDGKPQPVGTFSLGDNVAIPRSIVLIMDYSYAQLGFIKSSVEAAKTLVDKLGPRDRMAIVTDDVKLRVDFTQDKTRLKKEVDSFERDAASGDQSLVRNSFRRGAHYSALMATLKELFSDEDLRPIIILQAHGNEASLLRQPVGLSIPPNLSLSEKEEAQEYVLKEQQLLRRHMREFSLNDLYAAAEKSRATIYTVIPALRLIGLPLKEQVERIKDWESRIASERAEFASDGKGPRQLPQKKYWELALDAEGAFEQQRAMVELAKRTGGWADFIEDPSQAAAVYSRILSNINGRYVIGYYPSNKEHDGKRREVKIEVRGHSDYTIWGRKSYFAAQDQP